MNVNFNSFKPYTYYSNKNAKPKKPLNLRVALGSAAGVLASAAIVPALLKKSPLKSNAAKEVISMLSMAALADVGAVAAGSKGATKEQRDDKIHEAKFQIMNSAIPMLIVTAALSACDKIKFLNNKAGKIAGSAIGMLCGMFLATKITNATKDKDDPERKYSLKDSLANFDDIVATIVIGFPQAERLNKVAKTILPFIYGYCGYRAGVKEN